MAENDPTLGLDAQDFFTEVEKIEGKAKSVNELLKQVAIRLTDVSAEANTVIARIRGTDEAGTKFTATLKKIEDQVKISNVQFHIAADALGDQAKKLREADKTYNQIEASIRKADAAVRGF